jgi:hypothetical protein
MVTCGRHEVVAKNGVVDLQAGEKWASFLLVFFISNG